MNQIEVNLTQSNPQFVKFVHNISHLHIKLNTVELNETRLPMLVFLDLREQIIFFQFQSSKVFERITKSNV